MPRAEFAVHMLNETGKSRARTLADLFSDLLDNVEFLVGSQGREIAIVRTKLEEASFFAKKAMASRPENQQ
jgi:hypothetical protein